MLDKTTIRPLIGLLRAQPQDLIETLTIEQIREHRRLIDVVTKLELQMNTSAGDERAKAEYAYLSAMITLHTQQTAVSTLVDLLGYIPHVSSDMAN